MTDVALTFVPVVFDDTYPDQRRDHLHMAEDGFNYGFRALLHWSNVDRFDEVVDWCKERYGAVCTGYPKRDSWVVHDTVIWFASEDHAMEFKLRWL
jgi:hypothetical protein